MFDALALNGFAEIAARGEAQFGPKLKLYIAHAKGRLGIGDLAVVVAAGTPHRDEAFRACRMAIEAVKKNDYQVMSFQEHARQLFAIEKRDNQ